MPQTQRLNCAFAPSSTLSSFDFPQYHFSRSIMPLQLCSYQWPTPNGIGGHHLHDDYDIQEPFWDPASWYMGRGPCCEWCVTWRDIIQTPELFFHDLYYHDPDEWEYVWKAYRRLHQHYKHNLRWDSSYQLARDVDLMSQRLRKIYRWIPAWRSLGRLSQRLKIMSTELQIGPQRKLYYAIPKMRRPCGFF
ncbi:hypothetical protein BCR34DRAFT_564229 [Clohesyomyces aquaticus]|uniref:Uncharacterized protein n=1 Tax=Clohesyomyces aquaticus TaxID=1231657 RepID=A0A1Y1ZPE8_9PLEO|nr:hypothetical protein BCR34DRAFT_564229 [Clohesyomyces aquaticus]